MVAVMHAAWRAILSITLGVLNAQDANLVRNSNPQRRLAKKRYKQKLADYNDYLKSYREEEIMHIDALAAHEVARLRRRNKFYIDASLVSFVPFKFRYFPT
jgi:hypothetical protein